MDSKKEIKLTDKQEKFCLNIVSGMTQIDAYKNSYNAENMKDDTIYAKASVMCKEDKISKRIAELKEPIQKAIEEELIYTAKESFKKLQMIQDLALTPDGTSGKLELNNAIKAEELKGKLYKLYSPEIDQSTIINIHLDKQDEDL